MSKRSPYGNSLKDFKLGDQIGHGGFAKVFKAKCLAQGLIGQYVAIKRIDKKPQIWNKIKTEIDIHSSLPKNPDVVEFYTSFEDENYWYLVMELCTGGSLEKYLERKGCLSEKEAIPLIRQVIEGVSFLHKNCILHRDLSLRNLLLTDSQNQVKIVDFGLAVKLDKRDEKISAKVGTANFMAPEVVKDDSYSYKADCWSVGCVLYALLCGSLPFNAETKAKIHRNIKRSKLEFPDNVETSTEAKKFLESLLNKNPENRISFPEALRDPLFRKYGISGSINQVSYQKSSDSGMSFSSKSQFTHTSSSGPVQCKSQKEKKSKSVRSNNISGSYNNLSESTRFGYQSHQVISQKQKFDHAPYQTRNSKENKTCMEDERNTFVKEIVHPLNTVRKSSRQMEIERKDVRVSYQKCNADSGVSSSSKTHSTHSSTDESNQHRPLRNNNNVAGIHDNLCDKRRFGYQSHQEISKKQRFDHDPNQDRNSREMDTYMDERNTFVKETVHPLNTVINNFRRMEIERKDVRVSYQKNNGDNGVSSSSKTHSTHTSTDESNQHRPLRNNNNVAGSHDNLSDKRRFGYQSHQEISQKQRFDHDPYQNRQMKENKNYTGVQNTVVTGCLKDTIDPLNTTRLRPRRKEFKNFMISILSDGQVCLECLKYRKTKIYVRLFYHISDDGLIINIYKPKKKILLNQDRPPYFSRSEHEFQCFTFENLPKKEGEFCHWRNYNFAKMYVDSVRGITPKITIYGPSAVCKMMENTPNPNYEMEFYNGKYNGFQIKEKNQKVVIKDKKGCVVTKKDCINSMLEEFEHMKQRCIMQEKNVERYQESTFPVTLGNKPYRSKRTMIPDYDKENSPPTFLQSPSVNGLNSDVPIHIITTSPEYSFNTFQRSTSTSYSGVKSISTTNITSSKSITDIIPNVQYLKVLSEWIIAEYIDGIQMWLSLENDDVIFKLSDKQTFLSIRDHPELRDRYEHDYHRILRCAININKT